MLTANVILDQYLVGLDQPTKDALMKICLELERALQKHPSWPTDPIHRAAVIEEEAGEMIRASLHLTYENGTPAELIKEVVQTAATCIRFLICLDSMIVNPTQTHGRA